MRRTLALALVLAPLLAACATAQLERGKDLSTAGIAYAKATEAVIDVAIDGAIDASSERQIAKRMGPAATRVERDERTKTLNTSDDELVEGVRLYTRLQRSVGAVGDYFAGLQALAGAKPAEATEAAVKSLAERVSGLNVALGRGTPISAERQTAFAGLARQVVKQAHGAAVAHALERDAEVIDRALVLQELTLATAKKDVAAHLALANQRFYQERVLAPFLAGGIGTGWAEDRRPAVRVKALGSSVEALDSAETAARQMQVVWRRILSGETSSAEVLASLKDTEELLGATAALKQANRKQ